MHFHLLSICLLNKWLTKRFSWLYCCCCLFRSDVSIHWRLCWVLINPCDIRHVGRQKNEILLHYNRFHFPEDINCVISSPNMAYVAGSTPENPLLLDVRSFKFVNESICFEDWKKYPFLSRERRTEIVTPVIEVFVIPCLPRLHRSLHCQSFFKFRPYLLIVVPVRM